MKSCRWLTPIIVCSVVLLWSGMPAWSGVHLWRVTELFSNADGTIQFIEMTTCCGSAGGEIFLNNQHLSSNSHDFIFPGNLGPGTNHHILLGTAAFAALPGAPTPNHIIPANFFSTGGDTITFAVYDTMIFGAGTLPTNGTSSLNKNQDDATDTAFVAVNSPTNLSETTGSVNAGSGPSGPPAVPDGRAGTTPVTVSLLSPDGTSLRVSYDTASCTNVSNHHLLYGQRSGIPSTSGGTWTLLGTICNIGNTSPYDWIGVPSPPDGNNLIWVLLVATDSSGAEGSWGVSSAGAERLGPGNNGADGVCSVVKDVANTCGQ